MKRFAVLCLLGSTACLGVADDRARLDLEVGRAASANVTVTVEDGLATVRSVTDTEIHLWANAPTFRFEVASTTDSEIAVRIENVLADARLESAEPFLTRERERPNEARYEIRPFSGLSATYALTTDDATNLEPWRFVVFADVQEAIDEVHEVFEAIDRQQARFSVVAGDLTEQGTVEEIERFQEEMRKMVTPAYVTLGNHELGASGPPYHDYFGRGTSSFVFRGVRFTFMDSASATISPLADDMLTGWLDQPDFLHAAIMHIPPLDPSGVRNGAFASRGEAQRLLGRLARGGVDMTFYGHIHSFYAFDNAGIPAYITGGGGAIPERLDGIGRHFLVVEVEPSDRTYRTSLVRVD